MNTLPDQQRNPGPVQSIKGSTYSVEVDLLRQLLTVIYAGDIGVAEARSCFNKVQTLLPNLKPGFRLLKDITHLKSMDSSCTPYLKKMMDLCDEKGVGMVVRVVSDPHRDIGFNIMSLFHYAPSVVILTCSNWDEAERALKD